MEQLDVNIKGLIGQNLTGYEMLRLCSTSTNMKKQCMSLQMTPFWKNKLKEEYHIDYADNDSFSEYMRQSWLQGETFVYVTIGDQDTQEEGLYRTTRDALNVMASEYSEDLSLAISQIGYAEQELREKLYIDDDDSEEHVAIGYRHRISIIKPKIYQGRDYYAIYESLITEVSEILTEYSRGDIVEFVSSIASNMDPNVDDLAAFIIEDVIYGIDIEKAKRIAEIFRNHLS